MFPELKKKLGFGCMRLKMKGEEVDLEEMSKMVDIFLDNGFNYFDTARPYLQGKSELALKHCLTSRYPRSAYILTDKLSESCFQAKEDIEPFLDSQLEACGVSYFDFYLMHNQNSGNYQKFKDCQAYEEAYRLKKAGKIKHVGLSFHDSAEFLDRILTENPDIEAVQLQFNYLDYEDDRVQSRLCYEVCCKYGKPVLVMEPVRGGGLVNMPDVAGKVLDDLHGGSRASYALRFVAGFDNVVMILSGMGSMAMMEDNIATMKEVQPLNAQEQEAVRRVAAIIHGEEQIPCTGCRYCVDGCPQQIPIPDVFSAVNQVKSGQAEPGAWDALPGGKAADCIGCGKCEKSCPQFITIRKHLKKIANM